jgi:serine-type D-Ala-D-Ala carboxypeptidase/endopeptidase (penicillin-binding protein 4)
MWDDMNEAYSAGVGALQFNMGETIVTVTPAASEGIPATLAIATAGSGLMLRNHVMTGATGSPVHVTTKRIANRTVLEVSGSVPVGGAAVERRIAVDNQTRYFVEELRQALIANGIEVKGPAVDIDDLAEPVRVQDAMPLLVHRSPPLRTLAEPLMQISQNQYAETLLKTLGAQAGTPTFDAGLQAVTEVLTTWGIDPAQVQPADGSGLSRYDIVSADALAAVLTHVARDPRLDGPFRTSLPVAGMPGMLSERMKGTPAAGQVQAKTGSMRHVRSISGYTRTADGEPIVFSIIANNFGVSSATIDRTADEILLEVFTFTR